MALLRLALTSGMIGLLALAAWRDLATRTIPNAICLAVLLLAAGLRVMAGPGPLLVSIATAAGLLVILTLLHAKGALGGGDVKLAVALAIALSPWQILHFVEATAILGGVLAAFYLLLSRFLHRLPVVPRRMLPLRVLAVEANRICRRASLPYGVALALAGTLILSGA